MNRLASGDSGENERGTKSFEYLITLLSCCTRERKVSEAFFVEKSFGKVLLDIYNNFHRRERKGEFRNKPENKGDVKVEKSCCHSF